MVMGAGGGSRRFGRFEVAFLPSRHAPIDGGQPPFPGRVDAPLVPPAPVSAWREGGSFSIVIRHPRAAFLVQGSAGFVEGALDGVRVDAVLLGVGALSRLGRGYAETYWDEIVGRTGARRVFLVHWDDFTRPFGDLRPAPRFFDDVEQSLGWLSGRAEAASPPVRIERLPFAEAVAF